MLQFHLITVPIKEIIQIQIENTFLNLFGDQFKFFLFELFIGWFVLYFCCCCYLHFLFCSVHKLILVI